MKEIITGALTLLAILVLSVYLTKVISIMNLLEKALTKYLSS